MEAPSTSVKAELETPDLDRLMYGSLPPGISEEQAEFKIMSAFPLQSRRQGMEKYEAVHWFAATALPWAVEIERQFDAVDHFITHFGFSSVKSNAWNTEAFFGERYTLTMQVEIQIDYDEMSFEVLESPQFHLLESGEIMRDGGGSVSAHYKFSVSEFEKLAASGWDFRTIGITIDSTPCKNFKIAEAMARAPRYPISLLQTRSPSSSLFIPLQVKQE